VALVSLFDIFNGTAHDEDPYEKGWILEDHVHPTEAGTEAIVKALAAAGFELTQHP
jgi:lysophospholipase L1-like esterase